MSINPKDLLLVFTRNPQLGKCKTRLAATIGDTAALDAYKFLLQHTANLTQKLKVQKYVYYSEEVWEDDLWSQPGFEKKLQEGGNLGIRMANAFKDGFDRGYEKIVIIGSDVFDLSARDIQTAFNSLNETDYVIGPAEDGGYYLLGMKKMTPSLFENKTWGQETVLQATLNDLEQETLTVLETRNDIDRYEDIKNIPEFQPFIKHLAAHD